MRKFIITIEGKSYEVGVEEVGAEQSAAPVIAAPAAPAAPATSRIVAMSFCEPRS